jgi:hypothetical protein
MKGACWELGYDGLRVEGKDKMVGEFGKVC